MSTNRHGLDRNIPSAVKRAVRQRCGFGCISCGATVYEYDHFDPPFAQAKEHSAEGIVLLCPTCHALKGKGVLSDSRIAEFIASPVAKRQGRSRVSLPHFKGVPALRLGGGVLISQTPVPIRVNTTPIVGFLPPEPGSDVTRLTAHITDERGRKTLRIVENEWMVDAGVWDFEWVGQRMTIRNASGKTAFQLFIAPPSYIEIEHLTARFHNFSIQVTPTELRVGNTVVANCQISQFKVGIQASTRDSPTYHQQGFGMHFVDGL